MKSRIPFFLLLFVVLLGGCAVQEQTDTDIFFERFSAEYKDNLLNVSESYTVNGEAYYFITLGNAEEILLITKADENGTVYKITLSSSAQGKEFLCDSAAKAFSVFTLNTDVSDFFGSDFIIKNKSGFYDMTIEKYLLNFSSVNGNLSFSIQNTKLLQPSSNELTLKVNDKAYLENGEAS